MIHDDQRTYYTELYHSLFLIEFYCVAGSIYFEMRSINNDRLEDHHRHIFTVATTLMGGAIKALSMHIPFFKTRFFFERKRLFTAKTRGFV